MTSDRLRAAADRLDERARTWMNVLLGIAGESETTAALLRQWEESAAAAALLRNALHWRHVREWGQCVPYCPLCSAIALADAILGGTE